MDDRMRAAIVAAAKDIVAHVGIGTLNAAGAIEQWNALPTGPRDLYVDAMINDVATMIMRAVESVRV